MGDQQAQHRAQTSSHSSLYPFKIKNTFILFNVQDHFAHMHVCSPCMCLMPKEVISENHLSWNWELGMALSHHVGAGN